MKAGWQAPLAALILVIVFAAFNAKPIATAADIAAWVQGVGSLLAIIAAVWIYARQYADRKADDENETRAFVQAIRDEIRAVWHMYEREVSPDLSNLQTAQGFRFIFPVSADALTIYNGASTRVGKIADPELRRLIVETYAQVKGIINNFQINNQLLSDHQNAMLTYHEPDRDQVLSWRTQGLVQYALDLGIQERALSASVTALLSHIETWLSESTAR